jgi:hypothetical protein
LPQVIDAVGSSITKVRDFETLLTPAIQFACDYFDEQIGVIPGPLEISAAAGERDPRVAALFPAGDDISAALGRSVEVKESLSALAGHGHQHVHALLGMRSKPGSEAGGHPVLLVDHTIRSLAPKESDAREYLRLVAFSRLVKHFVEHVDKLRRKDMRQKLEYNLQNELAGNGSTTSSKESVDALTPENLLKGLVAWLNSPSTHFRIDPNGLRLGEFELPLLHTADRRQWLVCMVRFSCQDGLKALAKETRNHRYILI